MILNRDFSPILQNAFEQNLDWNVFDCLCGGGSKDDFLA